jgi:hypothetical protein
VDTVKPWRNRKYRCAGRDQYGRMFWWVTDRQGNGVGWYVCTDEYFWGRDAPCLD